MDDPLDAMVLHQRLDVIGIGHVHPHEAETVQRLEIGQPGGLERRIIIIVQIVDADHAFPAFNQPRRNGMTDEPGGAGHQHRIPARFIHMFSHPRLASRQP